MKVKILLKFLTILIVFFAGFPLTKYINPIFSIFTLFSIIISLKYEIKSRWILNFIGILTITFTAFRIYPENLVIPIIEALFILIGIKFLEDKKYRDYMQIYLMSLFLAAGFSLLTMKLFYFIYLTILLILLTLAGIILTFFDENEEILLEKIALLKILFTSFLIFIFSLPVATSIFIILPRVNNPIFNYLNQEKRALSGFTSKLTLGDVKEIQEDNSIIFRVVMKKIENKNLYWRGLVLDYFDGKTWKNSGGIYENIKNIKIRGKLIKQIIYLEPYYNKYLFVLDKPVIVAGKKTKINGLISVEYYKILNKRIRYLAYSIISNSAFQNNIKKKIYLELPEKISVKILKLAKTLKTNSEIETLKNIEDFFYKNNFKYEIKDLPLTDTPIKDFLFKYKKGNCEYFASSLALLLRLCKIPSRIIAGYKGGEYSDIGKYYIVRQKNAHVWVEAYINKRWLRIDPVKFAVISPFKKLQIKRLSKNYNFLEKLKIYIDIINFYWIKFIINYNFQDQIRIFIKFSSINKNSLQLLAKFILLIIFLILIPWLLFKSYKTKEQILIDIFSKKMKKLGYSHNSNETLRESLEKIKEIRIKKRVEEFILNFERLYFKDKSITYKEYNKLKKLLNKLDKDD